MTADERKLLLLLASAVRMNLDTPGSISRQIRELMATVEREAKTSN